MSGIKVGALNPNAEYAHYDRLMEITRELLPALDGIASDAAIIASEQVLDVEGGERLTANIEAMDRAWGSLDELNSGVVDRTFPEGLVVCAAIRGGFSSLLLVPRLFADNRNDPEVADIIDRQSLHPFYRLYSGQVSLRNMGRQAALVNITIDGDYAERGRDYYKKLPMPTDIVEASEVVYGLVFSALLLSAGERNISLNFKARVDDGDKQWVMEVENSDGIVAGALSSIASDVNLQPSFLRQTFAAGLSVHGSMIQFSFRAATIK